MVIFHFLLSELAYSSPKILYALDTLVLFHLYQKCQTARIENLPI